MIRILLLIIFFFHSLVFSGQIKLCSWNISHLGKSKNIETIKIIAETIENFDLTAIQEVVSGEDGGPVAVRKIIKELNKNTTKWKYTISPPTTSANYNESERYAYIFNSEKIKLIYKVSLPHFINDSLVREPYAVRFEAGNKSFITVNFHAVPRKKNPQKEIKWFKFFPQYLNEDNIIFFADWNTADNDNVFNPLKKQGFSFAIFNQATTLKMECVNNNCLANPLDNILYNTKYWRNMNSGIVHFYRRFHYDMKAARRISDHCPVFITLNAN